jgi:hypothetical protein
VFVIRGGHGIAVTRPPRWRSIHLSKSDTSADIGDHDRSSDRSGHDRTKIDRVKQERRGGRGAARALGAEHAGGGHRRCRLHRRDRVPGINATVTTATGPRGARLMAARDLYDIHTAVLTAASGVVLARHRGGAAAAVPGERVPAALERADSAVTGAPPALPAELPRFSQSNEASDGWARDTAREMVRRCRASSPRPNRRR